MFQVDPADLELILVEEKIWVLVGEVGLSIYTIRDIAMIVLEFRFLESIRNG